MEITERISLPEEETRLRRMLESLRECVRTSARASEDIDGPKVAEKYQCPCGTITLEQKSIIKDVETLRTDEIVSLKSTECKLRQH